MVPWSGGSPRDDEKQQDSRYSLKSQDLLMDRRCSLGGRGGLELWAAIAGGMEGTVGMGEIAMKSLCGEGQEFGFAHVVFEAPTRHLLSWGW